MKRNLLILAFFILIVNVHAQQKKSVNIMDALRYVHETIRDVNGDGLINCIDYTVRFYEVVPGTKIYRSSDPIFNHLFVLARDESHLGYQFIEPQHYSDDKYLMREVWGNKIMDSVHIYEEKYWTKFATRIEW